MPAPEITTYLAEPCTMPFCKGCGHTHALRKLNEALVKLNLAPSEVCLVTDIGCIGLADSLFALPHTLHTTHGRSTGFAAGVELADSVLADSKLKTIVLIGDGGAMIGLLHLVNAALLNADVTVLLCNNFLFGMTGGQHSAFSPVDFITPTTPEGNILPPIDLCRVLIDSRADFVARKLATDKDLSDVLAAAIAHPGFAIVEIVELCTEHATTRNELTGAALRAVVERNGQELGILKSEPSRAEFGSVYGNKFPRKSSGNSKPDKESIAPAYQSTLDRQRGIVLAGSAGERVQSAGRKFCEAAALSGLHCTQKNDNPVTQGSGFSVSEMVISPRKIHYTGIEHPDAVIVVSADGLREMEEKHLFEHLAPDALLIIDASLPTPATKAEVVSQPFRKEAGGAKAAMKALEFYVERCHIIPMEAFRERCTV